MVWQNSGFPHHWHHISLSCTHTQPHTLPLLHHTLYSLSANFALTWAGRFRGELWEIPLSPPPLQYNHHISEPVTSVPLALYFRINFRECANQKLFYWSGEGNLGKCKAWEWGCSQNYLVICASKKYGRARCVSVPPCPPTITPDMTLSPSPPFPPTVRNDAQVKILNMLLPTTTKITTEIDVNRCPLLIT